MIMNKVQHTSRGRTWVGRAGAAALATAIAGSASAAWDVRPTIKGQSGFNDNVRLFEEEDDGIVSTATVQLGARWAEDQNRADLVVSGSFTDYQDVDDLDDSTMVSVRFNGDRRLRRGGFGIRLRASKDDDLRTYSTLDQGFDPQDGDPFLPNPDSPINDIDINDSAIENIVERVRINVNPHAEFDLSERSRVRAYYRHVSMDVDETGESFGYIDHDRDDVGVNYFVGFTERTGVGVDYSVGEYSADGREASDSQELRIGLEHQFDARNALKFFVGAREVDNGETEEDGSLVRIEFDRRLPNGRLLFSAERSLYPGAFGNLLEGDVLDFYYRKELSERWQLNFQVQAISSQSDGAATERSDDRDYFQVRPELVWQMSRQWSLHMEYAYQWTERERDLVAGFGSTSGNSVTLGISYQPRRRF
jgi:hypothetical protein